MNGLVVVGAAGAAGAVSRHLLDVGLRRRFPDGPSIGILVANVVGSLVLGVLTGVLADHVTDPELRLAVSVGFCGGLTTFSTFMAQLAEELDAAGPDGRAMGGADAGRGARRRRGGRGRRPRPLRPWLGDELGVGLNWVT